MDNWLPVIVMVGLLAIGVMSCDPQQPSSGRRSSSGQQPGGQTAQEGSKAEVAGETEESESVGINEGSAKEGSAYKNTLDDVESGVQGAQRNSEKLGEVVSSLGEIVNKAVETKKKLLGAKFEPSEDLATKQ